MLAVGETHGKGNDDPFGVLFPQSPQPDLVLRTNDVLEFGTLPLQSWKSAFE